MKENENENENEEKENKERSGFAILSCIGFTDEQRKQFAKLSPLEPGD